MDDDIQRCPRRFLQHPLSVFRGFVFRIGGVANKDVRIPDPLFRNKVSAERYFHKHSESPRLISIRSGDCPMTGGFVQAVFIRSISTCITFLFIFRCTKIDCKKNEKWMGLMAYCLYLRKSRADLEAEAHGEGETLARHEKALIELAARQKLNVEKIYREIVSGETIASRPVMQQLLNDVREGAWDGVLVVEVERLARGDTIDQGIVAQTFQFSSTKIITPLKTYDPNNEYDEEYFEFGLFMSRREYKTINRRLQSGRTASVREGKYVANKAPYGYLRKKLQGEKGYTLVPDAGTSSIVQMIFFLYACGERKPDGTTEEMGTAKIVRKLNGLKIPSASGKGWTVSTVQGMLRNPAYIGKIRWNSRPTKKKLVDGRVVKQRPREKPENWILTDGLHEPLIDLKTWKAVREKLNDHASHPCPKEKGISNPLAGLLICGKCGRRLVRRPYPNNSSPDVLMCPAASCDNVSSALKCVESRVLEALRDWLAQYQLSYPQGKSAESEEQTEIKKKALRNAQSELKKLEKQRDSIHDLLEQGVYSADTFLDRTKGINRKTEEIQEIINQLEQEIPLVKKTVQNTAEAIFKAEQVLAQYGQAKTPAEKNRLLNSVIAKVVYTKTVNGRWHGQPDDFELILYPKLPGPDITDKNTEQKNSPILK